MKKFFLILILLTFGSSNLSAQDVTLFNKVGAPIAYIDYNEDATVFLWNGTPVAFLENDGLEISFFGFNGNFLGWYEDGIIYDKSGYFVGANEDAINIRIQREFRKGRKEEYLGNPEYIEYLENLGGKIVGVHPR